MANKERGEYDLTIGDTTYTLKFSINALCEVEEAAGESIELIAARLVANRAGLRDLRVLLWGGLRDKHGTIDLLAAGALLGAAIEADGLKPMVTAMTAALAACFPAAQPARPPQPARRRGAVGASSAPTPSSSGSTADASGR